MTKEEAIKHLNIMSACIFPEHKVFQNEWKEALDVAKKALKQSSDERDE